MNIRINKDNVIALLGACGIALIAFGDVEIHNMIENNKKQKEDIDNIENTLIKANEEWKVISREIVNIGEYDYVYTILEKKATPIIDNSSITVYNLANGTIYENDNGEKVYRKTLVQKYLHNTNYIIDDSGYQLSL